MALARPALPFVGKVVGGAGKGIDGRHMRARVMRQQPRGDRKILVMAPGIPDAGGVGIRYRVIDHSLYHSVSGIPAR
jgi:hypothetical protein